MKLLLLFFIISVASAIIPNNDCFQLAKRAICRKYYSTNIKDCLTRIKPIFNNVSTILSLGTICFYNNNRIFDSIDRYKVDLIRIDSIDRYKVPFWSE